MASGTFVLRCDGNLSIGAGHVGRCLPIAAAARRAGYEALFVGAYDGVASDLLSAAGFETRRPDHGRTGLPGNPVAAVIDVYGIPADEIDAAAAQCPVARFSDSRRPRATTALALDYHLDAVGDGLIGPDFAPIDPRFVAARQPPVRRSVLVTLGGSTAAGKVLSTILDAVTEATTDEPIQVVGEVSVPTLDRVKQLGRVAGLPDLMSAASWLVCGAGVTAYEAACAGRPALLIVVADNQERVAHAFAFISGFGPPSFQSLCSA